jgi:hypothetical protein
MVRLSRRQQVCRCSPVCHHPPVLPSLRFSLRGTLPCCGGVASTRSRAPCMGSLLPDLGSLLPDFRAHASALQQYTCSCARAQEHAAPLYDRAEAATCVSSDAEIKFRGTCDDARRTATARGATTSRHMLMRHIAGDSMFANLSRCIADPREDCVAWRVRCILRAGSESAS